MYYEERVIGGALNYRLTPDGEWTVFTRVELTMMLTSARNTAEQLARFGRPWLDHVAGISGGRSSCFAAGKECSCCRETDPAGFASAPSFMRADQDGDHGGDND